MPVINWNDCYSVGIPQIDEHHQHLFFLVNQTYDKFISRDSAKNLAALFDELIDYATYHFSMEEHWMRESNYPELAIYQKEHGIFSKRVGELQSCYHEGEVHLSLEVLSFLHNWLSTHILQSDAAYGCFVAAENGPPPSDCKPKTDV